jgi:hypothetical protein
MVPSPFMLLRRTWLKSPRGVPPLRGMVPSPFMLPRDPYFSRPVGTTATAVCHLRSCCRRDPVFVAREYRHCEDGAILRSCCRRDPWLVAPRGVPPGMVPSPFMLPPRPVAVAPWGTATARGWCHHRSCCRQDPWLSRPWGTATARIVPSPFLYRRTRG